MTSLALIGPGRHGTAIAQLFASHGVDVNLYHHRSNKAQAAARAVRAVAVDSEVTVAESLAEVVEGQEIVILATLWDSAQRKVIAELGDLLVGKILVDVSNPLDVTPSGIIPRKPAEGSAGQFVATLLPRGTSHVKAFSNLATVAIREGAGHETRSPGLRRRLRGHGRPRPPVLGAHRLAAVARGRPHGLARARDRRHVQRGARQVGALTPRPRGDARPRRPEAVLA